MNVETTHAPSIFAPLWKRKWLILIVAIAVAAGTYEHYKGETPKYVALTSLYLGGSNEQSSIGSTTSGSKAQSGRELANQVELINSSIIGGPVRARLRARGDLEAAKAKAKAAASATAAFIKITTEGSSPKAITDLGNTYATVYIERARANYFKGLKAAIANARKQLLRLETPPPSTGKGSKSSGGASASIQEATLASKISQLESGLSSFNGVQQVGKAKADPLPLSPTPRKNAEFAFVIGLLLAAIAVYALAQFNRRLSSLNDIEGAFGLQILTALPKVRSPVRRPDGTRAPAKSHLEPLRRLHTTLTLGGMLEGGREGGPRSILFLSAEAAEGRSTLVANLAHVQRDAGARVAVVEADLRRPVLGRLLGLDGPLGLADVLVGKATLDQAMQSVHSGDAAEEPAPLAADAGSTIVAPHRTGSVSALLSGEAADNPPALLASGAMTELLRVVVEQYDSVLIDTPPLLEVSDVLPLLALVDGIVLVARVGHTRDQSSQRLMQLLARTASAPVLGVVANCATPKDMQRHGFARASAPARRRRGPIAR